MTLCLRRRAEGRRLGSALTTVLLLAITGCQSSSDSDDATAPTQASATIGPAGGLVEGPDGIRVAVPAGALTTPTTITIARSGAGAPGSAPDGYAQPAAVYEFTPHGLAFALPVTISMPAAGAADAQVFTARGADGWSLVDARTEAGRTSWLAPSFSWFTVAACAPRAGDPYPCSWPVMTPQLRATPATAITPLDATQTGGSRVLRWRVTQTASLRMALALTAAADCTRDPRLSIHRGEVADGRMQYGAPVLDRELVMLPDPDNNRRSLQSVNWDLQFTRADNGAHWYWLSFRCGRQFTGGRSGIDGYVQFIVDIGPLPAFTTHPADASVVVGDSASFTVAASGEPAPTLQWQRSDDGGATWAGLPGATSAMYTTPAATLADNGSLYRAVASNSAGSIASNAARLNVTAPLAGRWLAAAAVDASGADAFDPSVGVDASGRAIALWHAVPPGASVSRTYFASARAGQPWSTPLDIGGGTTNTYDARVAVAPDGRAVAAWGYRAANRFRLAVASFDGSTWSAPQRIDTVFDNNTTDHRVAIDADGRAVVVWAQYDTGNVTRLFASIGGGGTWSTPQRIDRGSPAGRPAVAVNAGGRGFAVFTDGSSGAWALAAVPLDLAAGSIGEAVSVRDGSRGLGPRGVAIDAAGNAIVAWVDDSAVGYSVRSSRYAASTGRWSEPADLTGQNDTLPDDDQFAVAGSAAGDVFVTWRHRSFGPQGEQAVVGTSWRNGAWSALERHSSGRFGVSPRAAANANGRIVLTWLQYDADAGMYLAWGRVFDGSLWRPAQPLQRHARDVPVREEHALAIGDGDHAAALWLEVPPSGSGALALEAAFFAP